MSMSLNKFFHVIGTSRQSFHSKLNRLMIKHEAYGQLELVVSEVRKDHPGMSLRDLYILIQPEEMGRDKFESYFSQLGYGVGVKKSFRRTTDSTGVIRFDNLIEGKKLEGVNQVWVSDITYFRIKEKFYYLTFMMDLYSRRIVGHSVSKTLRTLDTTIPALKRGLRTRETAELEGLIIHSDGGGQYYSRDFQELTTGAKMLNSMGKTAYENPHAERVNGIIKNNYVHRYNPQSYEQLVRMTAKAVRLYNTQKPHSALAKKSPVQFEELSTKNRVIDKRKKEAKKEKNYIYN